MKINYKALLVASMLTMAIPAYGHEVGAEVNTDAKLRMKPVPVEMDLNARIRASVSSSTAAKWAEQDAKREVLRQEFEAKRASSTLKRVELRMDVAKKKLENTLRKMNATIEHLENIIARVESRIAKIKANGGVTTEAETQIALAKSEITAAKVAITATGSVDISSEDKTKANFDRIRTAGAGVVEHLRKAHNYIMMAVRSLMGLSVGAHATTTATTTSSN